MSTTKPFQLGSVSTGLRPEDLLPVFMGKLEELTGTIEEFYTIDDIEELMEDLHVLSPPFVYFGARQCTGCNTDILCIEASMDFGFWPDLDALHEVLKGRERYGQEYTIAEHNIIVELVGPIAHDIRVYDLNRNLLWEAM